MSAEVVGLIGIVVLFVLIFMRIWVGAAMALVGFLGYAYLDGWSKAFTMVGMEPYSQIAVYDLTTIPLFVLMGVIISNTGIGADLYNAASKGLGQVRGGLAMASVFASGVFAAVTGSSIACAVTIGKVAFPEMKKHNYNSSLAAGCIAAGGTIGILIPPSMGFILYGLLTEQSIGKLFMAGIIPGILQVIFYMFTIFIVIRLRPQWVPSKLPKVSFKEKVSSLKYTWPVVFLLLLVLGGIYTGKFTATEAGAIGSFGAIIVSLVARKLTKENLRSSMNETAQNTAMIVFMIVGAFIFMRFMAISKMPFMLSDYIASLDVSKYVILAGIVVFYIILGSLFDVFAAIILTLPIIYPTILACGFDPIWFGVIMVRLMEIGLITPPFGINCFVLSSAIDVPLGTTFRGIVPFLLTDVVHLALLIAIPELSLMLIK